MTNRVSRPILRCRLFTTARGGVPWRKWGDFEEINN